jgi:glycosyltransferase involved in cell wall biosynthesis
MPEPFKPNLQYLHAQGKLSVCSVDEGGLSEGDEIIVVDGGSTDQTMSVAKKHGAKVPPSHPLLYDLLLNFNKSSSWRHLPQLRYCQ